MKKDVPTIRSLAIGTSDMPVVQRVAFVFLAGVLGLSVGVAILTLVSTFL